MTTHQCHDGNVPGNTGLMVGEERITLDDAGEQPVPLLSRGNDYGGLIGFAAHLDGDTGGWPPGCGTNPDGGVPRQRGCGRGVRLPVRTVAVNKL
jgi:hypothetical protein